MFGFPPHNRTTYKNNFLRTITLQLKFSKNSEILKRKDDFVSTLSTILPNCANMETSTITFGNVNSKAQISPSSNGLVGFSFSSKDSFKKINITEDSIIINYNGQVYSDFEKFWDEIAPILKKILDISSIKIINWASIRKINIIQLKIDSPNHAYEGLGSVFNNALVNQYLTIPSNSLLVSGLTNFVLKGDGKNLKLVYGLIPFVGEDKELVLDIDLFCDNQNISIENLKDKFFEINQEIFNVFNWSLLDKTVNFLNES